MSINAIDRIDDRLAAMILAAEVGDKPIRLEIEIEQRNVINWLRMQAETEKIYWSDREDVVEIACLGIADEIKTEAVDRSVIEMIEQSELRWFGGLRFDTHYSSDFLWDHFGGTHFWLPRFELGQDGQRGWFACHLCAADDLNVVLAALNAICFDEIPLSEKVPQPLTRIDIPNEQQWHDNVTAVLSAFDRDEAKKVVLARKVTVPASKQLEPLLILKKLMVVAPHSFHFCFQVDEFIGFVGASPERLYHRKKGTLYSEALAGTRRRGVSVADDEQLANQLMNSAKERHEQRLVQQMIVQAFDRLCDDVRTDDTPTILKLAQLQHLYSQVSGQLQPDVTNADILNELHPTPAVGGRPREKAMQLIADLERFDRGWYAGAVGWICGDEAEFSVAIRCALVDGDQLHAFSGAGIVEGSKPEAEWDEIENKLLNFRRALVK